MLEVKEISRHCGGVQARKNVSVAFRDGEIHGIVGENGAGKSPLMKIISGVYPPDHGTIELNGAKISFHTPVEAYNAGIRIVHQELSLIRSLSIAKNMFIHKFRGASAFRFVDEKKYEDEARGMCKEWEIDIAP